MSYIYKIINDINNKIYIGKTNYTSIEKRFKEHCRDSKSISKEHRPLYSAMNKYGIQNFHIEEIESCSPEEASEREKYWIEYYGSFKNGYNATLGGDGKSYVDYNLVVKNYLILQNQKEVANLMGIDPKTVKLILENKKIETKNSNEVIKEKYGQGVQMLDKQTKKVIKIFNSYSEAGQWLIDNKLSNCKLSTIRTHISEVCNNKRKSAAGFFWSKV